MIHRTLLAFLIFAVGAGLRAQGRESTDPASPFSNVMGEYTPIRKPSAEQPILAAEEVSPETSLLKEPPPAADDSFNFKVRWNNGLEGETADQKFRVHVGGRLQADGVTLNADPTFSQTLPGAGVQDAVDLRRARLRVDGTMFSFIDWAAEFDFVNTVNDNAGLVGGLPNQPASEANVSTVPAPTDVWVTFTKLPYVGNVRVGNHKEPIGLEHMNSSRFLDFLERSFLQDAYFGPFNNGFSPGISLFNSVLDQRATYAVGVFKNVTNVFAYGVGDGELAGTARVTALPFYDEESHGGRLMHVGLSASVRDPDDGENRFRSRASLRNGAGALNTPYADTGVFFTSHQDIAAAEAALVWGPWHLQAEYTASWDQDARATSTGPDLGTFFTSGYYVQILYFLTGEHREYEREVGAFGRVSPIRNFVIARKCGEARGLGAWQLASRYSKLDLRNQGIDGGVIQDVTLGLNWFLNPNMKFQFNYIIMDRDAPQVLGTVADGWVHGFGARWAIDF